MDEESMKIYPVYLTRAHWQRVLVTLLADGDEEAVLGAIADQLPREVKED